METRRRTCIRPKAKRHTMALSPVHLNAVRGTVAATVARFGRKLPLECVEDAIQETFLNLWRSRAERMLDCLPYVRRAAANAAIDLLRRQGAQKRSQHLGETFDLIRAISASPHARGHPRRTRGGVSALCGGSCPSQASRATHAAIRQSGKNDGFTSTGKEITNVPATDH